MFVVRNVIISIFSVCLFGLIVIACTPKNANNSGVDRTESTEIVTDFTSGNTRQNNRDNYIHIDDFVIKGSELIAYHGNIGKLTIPNELNITSIGWGAFSHSYISSIEIPKEIISINDNAFENCHSLQSVTVSEDNEFYMSVDGVLFNKQKTYMIYYPHAKTGRFAIPDTVTALNNYAFASRSGLTSITIPASILNIGDNSFSNTVRLESIVVDRNNQNYTSIGGALYNKTGTVLLHYPQGKTGSYVIPNSVTRLGDYIFNNRTGLTSITIPNSVTLIGRQAFVGCSGLTTIDIPGSVTSIGEEAFMGCNALIMIMLHEGLTNIEDRAFYDCTNVVSINIPASVRRIGKQVFSAGYGYWIGEHYSIGMKLASINVNQRNQNYTSVDGVLFNKAVTELIHFPQGKSGSYSIPDTVTKIESYAFSNRTGLTSVTIPESVNIMGEDVFFGCSNLVSITVAPNNQNFSSADGVLFNKAKTELIRFPRGKTGSYVIPNTVTTIAKNAFAKASGLTSVTIPSSVTSIGETAFAATGLKSLALPNSIVNIGGGAFTDNHALEVVGLPDNYYSGEDEGKGGAYFFYGCLNLKRFIVSRNNRYYSTADGVLFSKDGRELIRFPQGRHGSYAIPNTVTSIRYKAFYKTEGLTSVTIPRSVTTIGDFAFDGSGITSLDIPNSVSNIGKYAFTRCLRLASVSIPAGVENMGDFVFYNCISLVQINAEPYNNNFFLAVNER
ncbi:MAG: leucine-rich repeat domain-containing protein [Treponema sp.]|nr:leucine-rich repeat domain-containing protein [Treponema sp.]